MFLRLMKYKKRIISITKGRGIGGDRGNRKSPDKFRHKPTRHQLRCFQYSIYYPQILKSFTVIGETSLNRKEMSYLSAKQLQPALEMEADDKKTACT